MKPKVLLIAILFITACSPIRGCVESQFTLVSESRLPRWLSLPDGYLREDVTVKLTYYVPLLPVDDAVFELVDRNGKELNKVTGQVCWHPIMDKKRNKYGGFNSDSEPDYVYVMANNTLEVIKHTNGPTFAIADDPVIVQQAAESQRCRKE